MRKTLEEIRLENGVLKRAVAEHIGVSYPTYSRYEADPRIMKVGDFEKVCHFLHVDRDDIILPEDAN